MRTRTKARQRAIEAMFESEQRDVTVADVFSRNPEVNEYAVHLATVTEENVARINELINTYAQGWDVERFPAVDRAIVRVAVAEMLFHPEVDTGVIISEAVDIANVLSTDDSAGFINGVLGKIATVRESLGTL